MKISSSKRCHMALKVMLTIRERIMGLSAKTNLHLISSLSKNQLSPLLSNTLNNPDKISPISKTKAESTRPFHQPKLPPILLYSNRYSQWFHSSFLTTSSLMKFLMTRSRAKNKNRIKKQNISFMRSTCE